MGLALYPSTPTSEGPAYNSEERCPLSPSNELTNTITMAMAMGLGGVIPGRIPLSARAKPETISYFDASTASATRSQVFYLSLLIRQVKAFTQLVLLNKHHTRPLFTSLSNKASKDMTTSNFHQKTTTSTTETQQAPCAFPFFCIFELHRMALLARDE